MFYVSHVGHRWATVAVAYKTLEEARRDAEVSCKDAMETHVHDCSESPRGKLVAVFSRWGEINLGEYTKQHG